MKPLIHSTKHYVQFTQFTVTTATVTEQILANAVAVTNKNISIEVEEGSSIKAVFIELWLLSFNSTAEATYVVTVEKTQSDLAVPSLSDMTTLFAYDNKKNILFTSQGLLGEKTTNPTPVLRQWLKIPKGKQRMGLGDQIRVNIAAIGAQDVLGCSFSTYKEYQ